MIKSKYILFSIILAIIFLVGCNKKDNSNQDDQTATINSAIVNNIHTDDENETTPSFSFSCTLNAFYKDDISNPLGNSISIKEDGLLSLSLMSSVTPDETMITTDIPIRIWILADGKPIEFDIFECRNYALSQDVLVDAFSNQLIDVSFCVSSSTKIISILYIYFPDEIPEFGLEFYGGISYTIVNSDFSKDGTSININNDYYLEVPPKKENYGIDIGTKDVKSNNNIAVESHHYEDVILSDNKELYIKFNSTDTRPIPYYVMILRDGIMIDIFEGNYTYKVDCLNGTRTFQYRIPDQYLSDSGLHTFQAIALPADEYEILNLYSSVKVRVQL